MAALVPLQQLPLPHPLVTLALALGLPNCQRQWSSHENLDPQMLFCTWHWDTGLLTRWSVEKEMPGFGRYNCVFMKCWLWIRLHNRFLKWSSAGASSEVWGRGYPSCSQGQGIQGAGSPPLTARRIFYLLKIFLSLGKKEKRRDNYRKRGIRNFDLHRSALLFLFFMEVRSGQFCWVLCVFYYQSELKIFCKEGNLKFKWIS